MNLKLEIKNISKSFGDYQVLRDVSFSAESGKALGFLGRNGAGKTTTLRIILDVFKPDSGEVLIDGHKMKRNQMNIGYLPEERGLYQDEKVLTQLLYFSQLKGASYPEAEKNVKYWLDRFQLQKVENKAMNTLSKGNRQKVQIIVSLLNDPDILILDEPFAGLDPINSQVMREIIGEFIEKKKIVIFSSHQMIFVEEFCQDIAIIDHGKIILDGNINVIRSNMASNKLLLNAKNLGLWQLKTLLEKNNYIEEDAVINEFKLLVTMKEHVNKDQILSFLIENKVDISCFAIFEPRLQDIFVEKVGEIYE